MYLQENQLFDNRYRLVRRLGNGASADVWLAIDTTAAGMKVAIKVFNAHNGMDTIGVQNFQREFTGVFNIKHQNLLTPTNYSLFEGTPYLVMPYMENGSVQALVGRSADSDVSRFLYHVASGLACLHEHNMVHQDIKPDNIMLDAECNFLITDFGISISSNNISNISSGAGTKAYMSPERFAQGAKATTMSDVWAMGATAYEMLTGDAPFGDNGGLVQASGERIPDLPSSVQPALRKLIMKCLDSNPAARPTASEVAKAAGRYVTTGNWRSENMRMKLIAASAAFVALLGGLYAVDYFRTKTYYYKDYVTEWAVPQGIGRLSGNEMRHRAQTYKFEYSRHKLQRVSLVNSKGKVISHTDTEESKSRYDDIRFSYTAGGKVDYAMVYDRCGKLLYKMDYDENLSTVTFRRSDKYGTEMNLPSDMSDMSSGAFDPNAATSRISRYLLEYNEKGYLMKRLYVGVGNVPRTNSDNIYGVSYEYDSKGRIVGEKFLGPDGKATCNNDGLASKEFKYDSDDNSVEARYYNLDHELTFDGNGEKFCKNSFDKYGNLVSQSFWLSENEPSVIKGLSIHEVRAEYKDGVKVKDTFYDENGKPMYSVDGYASMAYENDANGFQVKTTYLDDKGNVAEFHGDGFVCSYLMQKNDAYGNTLEFSILDMDGKEVENSSGVHKTVNTYDSIGNLISTKFFDRFNKPCAADGYYHEIRYKKDEFYRTVEKAYFDEDGSHALCNNGFAKICWTYNNQGDVTRLEYRGKNDELVVISGRYAVVTLDYDEQGNPSAVNFLDAAENHCANYDGEITVELVYDKQTNHVASRKTHGYHDFVDRYAYDERGNLIESKRVDEEGSLLPGQVVTHCKYNNLNQLVEEWYTDASDKKVNGTDGNYAKIVYKYDVMGNVTEKTYWDTFGEAAALGDGTHRWVHKFNKLDLEIYQASYDVSGNPIKSEDGDAEIKTEYDQYGRKTAEEILDGHGNATNGVDGWHKHTMEYNVRGKLIKEVYYDKDNGLALSKENEYAKIENEYDSRGNTTKEKRYDADGKCKTITTYKYNNKNKLTEMLVKDANGNPYDALNGYSRVVRKYDNTGITPVSEELLNANAELIASRDYSKDSLIWEPYVVTAAGKAFIWMQTAKEMAEQCPYSLADDLLCVSITYNSRSVTFSIRITNAKSNEIYVPALRNVAADWKRFIRDIYEIPSQISIKLNLYDKRSRYICSA